MLTRPANADRLSPFDGEDMTMTSMGDGEDSMRVQYEDPAQREEKRRLLTLLGPDPASSRVGKNGGKLSRRSTRIAGF